MYTHDLLTAKRLRQLDSMIAEISVKELKAKFDGGEIFKLIEVSNPEDLESGHIPGATNVPLESLPEIASRIFHQLQHIVVYCQDSDSSVAAVAAQILQKNGFSNVVLLKGGKQAWLDAGYALEGASETAAAE